MQNRVTALMAALFALGLAMPAGVRAHAAGGPNAIFPQEPAGQEAGLLAGNNAEAEKEYIAGRAAMRQRNWPAAIQAFKRTMELSPNYRDARKRLAEARTILNNEEIEAVAARYYDEGVAAMNRNDYDGALDAFEKVSRINRRYRDLEELYARLEGRLPRLTVSDSAARRPVASFNALRPDTAQKFVAVKADSTVAGADSLAYAASTVTGGANLDSLYQQALAALEREDWKSAVITFERIKFVQPDYRHLNDLAAVARTNLLRQAKAVPLPAKTAGNKVSTAMIIGIVVAGIGLALLGSLFIISRTGRALFYRWRGDDISAALLYERIIAQKPDRIRAYPPLAEIYLRLNRRDATAMRIFQRVLTLNLPTRHRAEIHTIVAEQDRHENQEPPAPRKPRRRKKLAAILNHVNTAAENFIGKNGELTSGKLANGSLKTGG